MHSTLKRMSKSFPAFFRNWGYQKKIKGGLERKSNNAEYINYIKNCNSEKQLTKLQTILKKTEKRIPRKDAPTPIDCGDPKPTDNDPYNMVDPVDRGHIFP